MSEAKDIRKLMESLENISELDIMESPLSLKDRWSRITGTLSMLNIPLEKFIKDIDYTASILQK